MQLTELYNYIFNPLFTLGFISLVFSLIVAGFLRMKGDKESISRSTDIIRIAITLFFLFVLVGSFTRLLFTYSGPTKVVSGMESFVRTYCTTEQTTDGLKVNFCHGGQLICNKGSTEYSKAICDLTVVPKDIFSCKSKLLWIGPCTDAVEDQISRSIQVFFISLTSSIGSAVANFGKDYIFKLPYDIIGHEKFAPIFSSVQSLSIGIVLAVFLFNYWSKLIRVFQDDTVVVFTTEMVNYIYAIIGIYIFPYILEMIMRICAYLVVVLTGSSSGQLLADFFVGFSTAGVIMASKSPVFMLYYIVIIIALVWLVVKNIKRYVWLLILYMISPIFGPLYFLDSTRGYFQSFFRSFLMTSFSVVIEVIIIMVGFTLSNIATSEGSIVMGAFAIVTFLLSLGSETLLREIMMNAGFQQMSSGGRYMKQMASVTNRMAVNIRRLATKGK